MDMSAEADVVYKALKRDGPAAPIDMASVSGVPLGAIHLGVLELLKRDAVLVVDPLLGSDVGAPHTLASAAVPALHTPATKRCSFPVGLVLAGGGAVEALAGLGDVVPGAPRLYARVSLAPYRLYVWTVPECDPDFLGSRARGSLGVIVVPDRHDQAEAWVREAERISRPCVIAAPHSPTPAVSAPVVRVQVEPRNQCSALSVRAAMVTLAAMLTGSRGSVT
ncbi:hypothetical protein J4H86_06380 [Spiractinospora alimapuensis]|uniref:hypothetical protein n=1 Tax=Spiractinospora alimapuensis TaxID=2820884 RepID=UPI001F3B8C34|nr:hypothetical protein [Spiractinospora alimapuensis]QVQ53382.1 hypothetical protein J4H86_06380 [Spiractinospora alimapuensis]